MKTIVRAEWERTLIVCGKCSKKVGGGFGSNGRTSLGKALKRYLGLGKGRKARVGFVESRCLGICPKRAVMVIDAGTPQTWQIVPAGMALDAVTDLLALSRVEGSVSVHQASDSVVPIKEHLT